MSHEKYLGDSVYVSVIAELDLIMLTTGSHREVEADDVIYLDHEVTQQLARWLQERLAETKEPTDG